ncbi:hypothetical protein MKK75_25680 [Methylobacterium sp. J-030]|uniref:hypothetical protein n=1 Tax=Methylobacterium sp. J-030 TaxID=2836627 RepID=UPI001FB958A4|nr:hypothetical protein [Methylobacterium sp. J-030]MCJ2072149.1 hypothetical protein [Methylobacterium sp. J-030]
MARATSFRKRLSPMRVPFEQTEELVIRFADRIGRILYDNNWSATERSKLNHRELSPSAGSDEDLASTVRNQIIIGLRLGVLTASVWLTVSTWEVVRQPPQPEDEDEATCASDGDDDPLRGDDGSPKARQFRIKPDYWKASEDDLDLDWLESKITLPTICLSDDSWTPRRDRPIIETYKVNPTERSVPLYIRFPHRALHELVKYADVPSHEWLARYKIYREQGRAEVPAVMWRYLAIKSYNKENAPSAEELSRIALDYLRVQGFEESGDKATANARNASLAEMARSVREQFMDPHPNLSASVVVSGNPRARRRKSQVRTSGGR